MAATMTKRGQNDNVVTYEFVCDSLADLSKIEEKYITIGSIATVIQGEAGFEVYMANSQKKWISLGSSGSDSGGSNSGSSESVLVNQNIISSIPETYEDAYVFQSNIQLNNHIITGNIYTLYSPEGALAIEIDPSIQSSLATTDNYRQLDPTQEYYLGVLIMHFTEDDELYSEYGDSIMYGFPLYQVSTPYFDILLNPQIVSLNFYKLPGNVINEFGDNTYTLNYLFSKIQPEATYDVSQLTYITPEAGE